MRIVPDQLSVQGQLDLRRCERLKSLGHQLQVQGSLRIGGKATELDRTPVDALPWAQGIQNPIRFESRDDRCPLRALPETLKVGGSLELRHCIFLEESSSSIQVQGSVVLNGCIQLYQLPEYWHVHGDLTICGAHALRQLPEWLRVDGTLRVIGTSVERLPKYLWVGQDLILASNRYLKNLGPSIFVGRNLEVHHTHLSGIPKLSNVQKSIRFVRVKQIQHVPNNFSVKHSLTFKKCNELETVGSKLSVGQNLRLYRCSRLVSLPDDLYVPGTLNVTGCTQLPSLPKNIRAKELLLESSPLISEIPEGLQVEQPIELGGTQIRSWPKKLNNQIVRWRGVRMPAQAIFAPETLSAFDILGTPNAELRRIMLERVGIENVLQSAKATLIDSDRDRGGQRQLYEVVFPSQRWRTQSTRIRFLHCRCPSTQRQYLLGVEPNVPTCRHAAAWLAGFSNPEDYQPVVET